VIDNYVDSYFTEAIRPATLLSSDLDRQKASLKVKIFDSLYNEKKMDGEGKPGLSKPDDDLLSALANIARTNILQPIPGNPVGDDDDDDLEEMKNDIARLFPNYTNFSGSVTQDFPDGTVVPPQFDS
jgi:hypothetical protein